MADPTLICLPHAGAGATVYRSWPPLDGLRITAVQLPGREERFGVPLGASFPETLADALEQALPQIPAEPYALFGHSFGAVLAFELARELERTGRPPARLVVSGSGHPGLRLPRDSSSLRDEEFVAEVERLAGYVHPALADPDMRELILPALRSDVEQHEAYRPLSPEPITTPISVYLGESDHLVSEPDARGWASWTAAGCTLRRFAGGHMYLAEDLPAVLAALQEDCGSVRVSAAASGPA